MAESIVTLNAGSGGPKLHTWNRTIGANSVEDEFTLPGEYPLASYVAFAESISIATANDHVMEVMAGASLNLAVRRIHISQNNSAGTAAIATFRLVRLTTAGTGGTAVTPAKYDNGDAASGATAMTLPTTLGTEGTILDREAVPMRNAASTLGGAEDVYEWMAVPNMKSLIVPSGTANGIAIKNMAAIASATVNIRIEFVERNFS